MPRNTCLRNPLHQGVWRCTCAAGGDYCSICILDHMGTPGLPHSVVSIAPLVGQSICGRCHGQPTDSINFDYQVCLCYPCAEELRVSRKAGIHVEMPEISDLPNPDVFIPDFAEVDQDREAERRVPLSPLQRLIIEKKKDIHQSLLRAYSGMNTLEESVTEALRLETELNSSRAEVQRLQAQLAEDAGTRIEMKSLQRVMDRLETISNENDELRSMNVQIIAEMEDVKSRFADAQAPKNRLEAEKTAQGRSFDELHEGMNEQLSEAMDILQANAREQAVEIAREAARKVTNVMPLIGLIDFENVWQNHDSAEKFLELAALGIDDWVSSDKIREVVRCCVRIAKFFGPSRQITVFADNVLKLVRRNKEEGLQLIYSVYGVYELTKDDLRAKEMLTTLLELLEKGEMFYRIMKIFDHLRKLIKVRSLCDFVIAASSYFQQERHNIDEWEMRLLSLPVNWSEHYLPAAENCITIYLQAARTNNFSDNHLLLGRLLCQREDPKSLFALIEKLSKELPKDTTITQELRNLIENLLIYCDAETEKSRVDASFGILKHLLKNAQPQEVHLLNDVIMNISNNERILNLAISLVKVLEILQNQEATFTLGFAVAKWAMTSEHLCQNTVFAQWLLETLSAEPQTLKSSWKQIAALIAIMTQYHMEVTEQFVLALIESKVPISTVCEFTVALLSELQAAKHDFFLRTLIDLVSIVGPQQTVDWMQLTKTTIKKDFNAVFRAYDIYNAFARRGIRNAEVVKLGKYLLAILLKPANHGPVTILLDILSRSLHVEKLNHALLLRIMKLWRNYTKLLPADQRPYELASYFIERVNNSEIVLLISKFEEILDLANGACATTSLVFAQVYLSVHALVPERAQHFISAALDIVKRVRDADQRKKMEMLIGMAVLDLGEPVLALFFLETMIRVVAKSPETLESTLTRFSQFLEQPGFLQTIQSLCKCVDLEYSRKLLEILTPKSEVAEVVITLLGTANLLLQKGTEVLAITAELTKAIQERPMDVTALLSVISKMLTKYHNEYRLGDKLLHELSTRSSKVLPLLRFVATLSINLMDAGVPQETVRHLSTVLLAALDHAPGLLNRISSEPMLADFVHLLNTLQGAVTLKDVERLLQPAQGRVLADVKTTGIRFFNVQSRMWHQPASLNQQIRVGHYSSWTFLDNERLFCCGGVDGLSWYYPNRGLAQVEVIQQTGRTRTY